MKAYKVEYIIGGPDDEVLDFLSAYGQPALGPGWFAQDFTITEVTQTEGDTEE